MTELLPGEMPDRTRSAGEMPENQSNRIRTVSRYGWLIGASLRKRRRWYDDDGGDDPPQEKDDGGNEPDWSTVPDFAKQELDSLKKRLSEVNSESAGRRHEIDSLESRIKELEASQKRQLEDQGQFKTLAEQLKAEKADLEPYKERTEALEKTIRESNERRIEGIPEQFKGLVPTDYSPEKLATWLDTNADALSTPKAPNLDDGKGGDGKAPAKLSEEEKQMARLTGVSEEDYAKQKARIEAMRQG